MNRPQNLRDTANCDHIGVERISRNGSRTELVAVGVDRIYGDMQKLGDFAVARDAQPDHGQQPEFSVEAGRFHLLPVPQQCVGFFHEIGIKR